MLRIMPLRCFACCVSSGRPGNVVRVRHQFGPVTWIVPPHDVDAYKEAGAIYVEPLGSSVNCAVARNGALELAFSHDAPCLMLDDDPTGKMEWVNVLTKQRQPLDLKGLINGLCGALDKHLDAHLIACTHITNAMFVMKEVSLKSTINGGVLLVLPNPLRFDETLPLNSDVDYGLQHYNKYGLAVRLNNHFVHFKRGNKDESGVGAYRTQALREKTVRRLMKKWPQWVSYKTSDPAHPVVRIR